MLGKLLKYDLKWVYKVIIVFYILGIVLSSLARVFSLIDNSVVFNVVTQILYGATIAIMINSLINCFIRLCARFISNLYRDEAYLTHTLPVDIKTIFLSKVITAIITIFTTVLVILICLFICYYSKENINYLKTSLELVAQAYDTTVIKLILLMSFVFFLEAMVMVLIGYVGIIIGYRSNKNKLLKSIIIGLLIYFLTQGLSLAIVVVLGFFNSGIMNLVNTTGGISLNAIKSVLLLSIIVYSIYNIIFYYIGQKYLEKGINVD